MDNVFFILAYSWGGGVLQRQLPYFRSKSPTKEIQIERSPPNIGLIVIKA